MSNWSWWDTASTATGTVVNLPLSTVTTSNGCGCGCDGGSECPGAQDETEEKS